MLSGTDDIVLGGSNQKKSNKRLVVGIVHRRQKQRFSYMIITLVSALGFLHYIRNTGHIVIQQILQNEKYSRDMLLQKTYRPDFRTKKKNNGKKRQYYVENSHKAIISKDVF